MLSLKFISAGNECSTYKKHIPSPLFRRVYEFGEKPQTAEINICGLGFYRLFVNGKEITKGLLAPYISNPDHYIYYDNYDVAPYLQSGKNVIGVELGNGMQNPFSHVMLEFQKARWLGAPRFALSFEGKDGGKEFCFEVDNAYKWTYGPCFFDDWHCGCFYDARRELNGWSEPEFDDSGWNIPTRAETPRGTAKLCTVPPVTVRKELEPVSVRESELAEYSRFDMEVECPPDETKGYLYDFGENGAGILRLKIRGENGQKITMQVGEYLKDGKLAYDNLAYFPDGYCQRDIYICKGEGEEIFEPQFTYHGFRYCLVMGLTPEQAKPETLTYLLCSSKMRDLADFNCSDERANELFRICDRSDRANFYYWPTDCPQREKNGWTGDANISSEHMLLRYTAASSLREWLCNIRAAQLENGKIPGIIPTPGFGYDWGNGPAWDSVMTTLPYDIYRFTGNTDVLKENAMMIFRYLAFIGTTRNAEGLIDWGLGDWLQPAKPADRPDARIAFTSTVMAMNMARTGAKIFELCGLPSWVTFARSLEDELCNAIRKNLIDSLNCLTTNHCQTEQAMAIYYGVFTDEECFRAAENLAEMIKDNGGFINCGCLGSRVIFHVLSKYGMGDLAYNMIVRPEYPSYGYFLRKGYTCLPECYEGNDAIGFNRSFNHHFFGDISNWFISKVAGIRVNEEVTDPNAVNVCPDFLTALDDVGAHYDAPNGRIKVRWSRVNGGIMLKVKAAAGIKGKIILPNGFTFQNGNTETDIRNGEFNLNVICRK